MGEKKANNDCPGMGKFFLSQQTRCNLLEKLSILTNDQKQLSNMLPSIGLKISPVPALKVRGPVCSMVARTLFRRACRY